MATSIRIKMARKCQRKKLMLKSKLKAKPVWIMRISMNFLKKALKMLIFKSRSKWKGSLIGTTFACS